jgi:hypothetical protein
MTQNPYEPPKAKLADDGTRRGGQPGEFDIGRCLSDSWSLTWASFPTWLLVGIVGSILLFFSTILFLPLFVVVPVLAWGATLFYLNVIDNRERFADLFSGFSTYATARVADCSRCGREHRVDGRGRVSALLRTVLHRRSGLGAY